MRSRNSLMRERREAYRDARLIVIASEGKDTERIYFKALAKEYTNPRVHVHILERSVDEQNNGEKGEGHHGGSISPDALYSFSTVLVPDVPASGMAVAAVSRDAYQGMPEE